MILGYAETGPPDLFLTHTSSFTPIFPGVGAEILTTTDGGKTFTAATGSGVLFLDAGARGPKSAVVNGLFGASYTTDGKDFKGSSGGGGQGQSVEGFGKNSYGIAGAFGGAAGGVAVSSDGGKSLKLSCDALDADHPVVRRLSQLVPGVSAGRPTSEEAEKSDEKSLFIKSLNERVQIRKDHGNTLLPLRSRGDARRLTMSPSTLAPLPRQLTRKDLGKSNTKLDGSFCPSPCATEDTASLSLRPTCPTWVLHLRDEGRRQELEHDAQRCWWRRYLMGARMVSETEDGLQAAFCPSL